MSYMICFYGLKPSEYRRAIEESSIVSQVAKAKQRPSLTQQDLSDVQQLVKAGVSSHWPIGTEPDGFVAFHWLMETVAEPIARMANKEDDCTGRFWEGRFKAQRITDEVGVLACAMYVDLNPVRAAMAQSPEDSLHTSAYDRLQAEQRAKIQSTAFELTAIPHVEVAKKQKETTVSELRKACTSKRRSPTGRQVLRDSWLSPLTMDERVLAQDAQPNTTGLRARDKGFLNIRWRDYIELLSWTGRQRIKELAEKVPESLRAVLSQLGIDASMWRDLVWDFKKYFGKSSCAGSPGSMSADAERQGKRWHRGQAQVRECFV